MPPSAHPQCALILFGDFGAMYITYLLISLMSVCCARVPSAAVTRQFHFITSAPTWCIHLSTLYITYVRLAPPAPIIITPPRRRPTLRLTTSDMPGLQQVDGWRILQPIVLWSLRVGMYPPWSNRHSCSMGRTWHRRLTDRQTRSTHRTVWNSVWVSGLRYKFRCRPAIAKGRYSQGLL